MATSVGQIVANLRILASMSEITVRRVTTLNEMNDALTVRRRVFIEEQNVPESLEIDAYDADPATSPAAAACGRLR